MHTTKDADLCASAFFQPKVGTRSNRIITIGHGNNINNLITTYNNYHGSLKDFAQSRDRKNSRNLARTITWWSSLAFGPIGGMLIQVAWFEDINLRWSHWETSGFPSWGMACVCKNVNPLGVDICGDQFMSSESLQVPSVVYDFTPHQRSQRNLVLVLTLSDSGWHYST